MDFNQAPCLCRALHSHSASTPYLAADEIFEISSLGSEPSLLPEYPQYWSRCRAPPTVLLLPRQALFLHELHPAINHSVFFAMAICTQNNAVSYFLHDLLHIPSGFVNVGYFDIFFTNMMKIQAYWVFFSAMETNLPRFIFCYEFSNLFLIFPSSNSGLRQMSFSIFFVVLPRIESTFFSACFASWQNGPPSVI